MMALLKRMRIKRKLKEGEVICSRCKGLGFEFREAGWGRQERLSCALCGSDGKVDWIRNVIGPDHAMPQQYWLERSFARMFYDWLVGEHKNLSSFLPYLILIIPYICLITFAIYGF
jgi:hypothetical protein